MWSTQKMFGIDLICYLFCIKWENMYQYFQIRLDYTQKYKFEILTSFGLVWFILNQSWVSLRNDRGNLTHFYMWNPSTFSENYPILAKICQMLRVSQRTRENWTMKLMETSFILNVNLALQRRDRIGEFIVYTVLYISLYIVRNE